MKSLRKLKVLFVLFVCFGISKLEVNAGVCDGHDVDSNYGTCKAFGVTIGASYGKINSGYFMSPGYHAITYTGNAVAFCLDPGLPRTDSSTSLELIREIDNSEINGPKSVGYYDDGIYRMYFHFYNALLWQLNNGGLNDSVVNLQRAYFEYALRIWTLKNDFDYLSGISSKYKIDAANFTGCAHYIDGSIKNNGGSYKKYGSVYSCFGIEENKIYEEGVANYYNSVGSSNTWENPLSITTDSKIVNVGTQKYYRYEFNIKFTNDKYTFFDGTYSKGIQYGDINLGRAEFYLDDLTVNGVSCSSGNTCYNYSGGGIVGEGEERQFIVELTEEQYNKLAEKSDDGSVSVTMYYGYQHPLNIENLFTARYDLSNTYQRMLVIQNYVHKDTISIGKEPEITKCEHTSSGYTNSSGNRVNNLSQYIASCGCSSVDKTLLSDGDLTYYNNKCSNTIIEESYSGSIGDCTSNNATPDNVLDSNSSDSNYDSYSLGYTKKIQINNYCTETCTESININDLKGRYTTKAGMYFEFKKYPNLVANKKCTVDINYSQWKKDYEENLKSLVNAYNDWQKAFALEDSKDTSNSCCTSYTCGFYGNSCCSATLYRYTATTYEGVEISDNRVTLNNSTISNGLKSEERTSCGSPINWQVDTKLKEFQNQSAKANAISSLKSDLKVCNSKLFGTTNENFYDFSHKLNYYYYQTYSTSDGNKVVKNNERASLGGVNDSAFKVSQTTPTGDSNENQSGSDVTYSTLTESGISNETIYTYNEDIYRNVEYKVSYEHPEKEKYAEIFTGNVKYNSVDGKTIKLGYGYDTSVSAIAKSDNKTYYNFSKLGASDNKIFNHFKDGNDIKRYCTYEITNDVIEGCEDGSCDSKLDVVFRIVDSNNIDPNSRLGTDSGFKNWDNIKGETVKSTMESSDTYNPENLEYSFTLDSATIKKIREYNSNCDGNECDPITYSSTDRSYSELSCNSDGNECTSKFIDELYKSNGYFGKNIATNIDGRNKWKYLIYNDTNGTWSIEENKTGKITSSMFSSLITQYKSLGVDVTP